MTVDASVGREPDPFLPLPLADAVRRPDRGGALPVLLRRAVRARLPHGHRRPVVHPQDRDRQPRGQRPDDPRRQPAGRAPAAPPARSSACARAPACATASTARSRSGALQRYAVETLPRPAAVLHARPRRRAGSVGDRRRRPGRPRLRGRAAQGRASAVTAVRRERARRRPGRPRDRALAPAARDRRARGRGQVERAGAQVRPGHRPSAGRGARGAARGQRRGRRRRRPRPRQAPRHPRRGARRASSTRST